MRKKQKRIFVLSWCRWNYVWTKRQIIRAVMNLFNYKNCIAQKDAVIKIKSDENQEK